MSIEWVNGAIEEIRAWGRSNGVVVDADEIRLLCDYASDYLDVKELADFAPVTFERLLLDIYPRKVIAPPESAAETVAASRTLVDFLLDSGEIGTKMAARMRAKIDEIAPEMPAALADTTKFGMAKSMFGAMGADALEAGTPYVATDDLVAAPRRPRSDDGAGDCDCPACAPLPAVRLAPPQEVAQGAREAGLLREAQLLVAWMLEGGRVPTVKGTLRVRDAARAARELGLTAPALAWDAALAIGLAEVSGRALTAPRGTEPLPDRDDETVLDLWAGVVAFLTGGSEADVTGFAPVDRELYGVHDMLYRAQAPLEVAALREYLEDTWAGDGPQAGEELDAGLAAALDVLARCGTVEHDGEAVRLTAHGRWGLREVFTRMGLAAPVAPDPAEGDAAALVALLVEGHPAWLAEQDIAAWLGRREPEEAAGELLAAVQGGEAAARGVALTIVDRLGPEAAPAVRDVLDDPCLRPHALVWLASHDMEAPAPTPREALWAGVDTLAFALAREADDPDEIARSLAQSAPSAQVIEDMWQVDHPDVAEVLDLLGRHLPDRALAKAARKAAFKARSRGIH
ncbi:hypothetical protein Skr01_71020 [Sphaerisporangium krabiense]|uniref:Uncharacterized protein n=1 Tax=Sphaerisporangium krabiense TaxID=763782 RepID=A0A7W9DSK3_9ACTN|nr:hypothetical protein [Sphaerisporangium krabiense]MBB5629244.1 hypothetical protein [Sphaerisporangium krabiense]GII67017.1 hypothetical protein Skr01_71020 [Sphaerisporangium krabiense]